LSIHWHRIYTSIHHSLLQPFISLIQHRLRYELDWYLCTQHMQICFLCYLYYFSLCSLFFCINELVNGILYFTMNFNFFRIVDSPVIYRFGSFLFYYSYVYLSIRKTLIPLSSFLDIIALERLQVKQHSFRLGLLISLKSTGCRASTSSSTVEDDFIFENLFDLSLVDYIFKNSKFKI
jgi:hypothetical protein